MSASVLQRAREMEAQLIAWRRDFHAHPELGYQETRTAARISELMEGLGYRVRTGVGGTGVVAERGAGRPMVALRADIDALPIQEENPLTFTSQAPGLMHACGHDAHTAIVLGAAALLSRESFPGTLRCLFQPAEEVADDQGISGAPRMIQDRAMEGVEAVLALRFRAGRRYCRRGRSFVRRRGHPVRDHPGPGRAWSYPAQSHRPNLPGRAVILALNGIVSRRLHPHEPAVISLGSIHGGETTNVIPERVELSGTIRYMALEVQKQIHTEIERALEVARALGGEYQMKIEIGYPPMYNDPRVVALIQEVITDLLGVRHIKLPQPHMGADDFGFFSNLAPGAMFYLGCRIDGDERKHHSPRFDLDERCLPIGAAVLAESALRLLRSK